MSVIPSEQEIDELRRAIDAQCECPTRIWPNQPRVHTPACLAAHTLLAGWALERLVNWRRYLRDRRAELEDDSCAEPA